MNQTIRDTYAAWQRSEDKARTEFENGSGLFTPRHRALRGAATRNMRKFIDACGQANITLSDAILRITQDAQVPDNAPTTYDRKTQRIQTRKAVR